MVEYFKSALLIITIGILVFSCSVEEQERKELTIESPTDRWTKEEKQSEVVKIDSNRIEVELQLKQKARKDWPNDFITQEYWVSQQLEDYEFMRSIPNDALKAEVERNFPLDYTTQKYWYGEQSRARNRMSN